MILKVLGWDLVQMVFIHVKLCLSMAYVIPCNFGLN